MALLPQENRQIILASRPNGSASLENFRLVTSPLLSLQEGQVRVRNHFLSVDPYMRWRMNDAKSYAAPQVLNEVMVGGTAGEVVESQNLAFAIGDKVVGMLGWQEFGTSDGTDLRKVDDGSVKLSAHLGVAGMPGVTAWLGLNEIIKPQASETIVVSAASGAVGSVVGQLARGAGCRTIGIAGGIDKCRFVVDTLGFDACIDYKSESFYQQLKAALPDGVDGYFENVGGRVLDAVLENMNPFGRIAMCGMIAGYDGVPIPIQKPSLILTQRLKLQGFIVSEAPEIWPKALAELVALVAKGMLRHTESISEGLESAPAALLGLFAGRNFGKQIVRLI